MKIKSAHLQTAINLMGTPIVGAVSISVSKFPGVQMAIMTEGLHVKFGKASGLIPWANVQILNLEETDGEPKSTPRKGA